MPRANKANNRSDLLSPKAAPITTAPGQAYGKQTAQAQSQKILPLAAPAGVPAASTPGPNTPPPPPQPAATGKDPGSLSWIAPGRAKTHGEPITSGMAQGAGPGPEAMNALGQQAHARQVSEQGNLQQLLHALASQPSASSLIKDMAQQAGRPSL